MAGKSKRVQTTGRLREIPKGTITTGTNTKMYYKGGKFYTLAKKKTAGGKGG